MHRNHIRIEEPWQHRGSFKWKQRIRLFRPEELLRIRNLGSHIFTELLRDLLRLPHISLTFQFVYVHPSPDCLPNAGINIIAVPGPAHRAIRNYFPLDATSIFVSCARATPAVSGRYLPSSSTSS